MQNFSLSTIRYFERPELPERLFFTCERLHATLSVEACAENWRRAAKSRDHVHTPCRACVIGAAHAGEAYANVSPLKGARLCARCHRGAMRLIWGHVCVSCYNREREAVIGRNAKGRRPVKVGRLESRQIWYIAGRSLVSLRRARTTDTTELVVAALRDSRDRVTFTFHGQPRNLAQLRLF